MCDYYFDQDRAVAFKVNPINSSLVYDDDKEEPTAILVHTNVKITNFKKEKIRRIISEIYPTPKYDMDSAKKEFCDTHLSRIIEGAQKISQEEYEEIKARVEV